ncbi:transcriptional regulator [Salimicrobium jeotgali]|uniref:SinR/xre family transcription regulator n=1 Tax=Salimicrobium jeotgali TaxID=1230341 RepID=K2GD39_9BACI|nr:helix-turn-helix domain-containing protein [Salimicrobium jeotgali]AKG04192.1 transcriptional regulator [Salimicrobium jeotgali]EKE32157.1 SinR/xre family transcription regulator [Salimicrobium jeotgali]MBM7695768.1 transcriptional regulator with XRE-family HTH domain [Salimicrobium jeotgali]
MLNKRLSLLRKEHNLKQEELAKILGVARTTYGMYEQGKRNPDYETLQKIADYFNVTADYLLGRSDDPNQNEDENFDPLEELKQFMIENNMQGTDLGFYDIEKWKQLSREDIEDVKKHFEYVLHRARERNKENK